MTALLSIASIILAVALMWLEGERRIWIYAIVLLVIKTHYNSVESHEHIHKVHNEVVGYEYYDENGSIK